MSNRIVKRAWLVALCLPTLVFAQQERGRGTWEFSLGGGIKILPSGLQDYLASGPPASRFSSTTPSDIMPGIAGRVGYNFSRRFAFSVGGEATRGSGITYLTPQTALTFTPRMNARTSPFLSVGTQNTRISGSNERLMHPTWGVHVGGGLRQMISNSYSLRLEGRVATEHYAELPGKKAAYPALFMLGLSRFHGGPRPVVMASAPPPITRLQIDTVRQTVTRTRVDTVRIRVIDPSVEQLILRVQFRTDAAELLPTSRPILDTIAMAIIETPGSRWEIQGHTDSVGTPAANKELSQARAQTVAQYLSSKGVNRDILTVVGFGEERPVFSNVTAYGRAQNRRVQLRRIPPAPSGQPVP